MTSTDLVLATPDSSPRISIRRLDAGMVLLWLALLAAVIGLPYLSASPTLGDDLTRYTIRFALAYYAVAVALMLLPLSSPRFTTAVIALSSSMSRIFTAQSRAARHPDS